VDIANFSSAANGVRCERIDAARLREIVG